MNGRYKPYKVLVTADASWRSGDAGFGFIFSSPAKKGRGSVPGSLKYENSTHAELAGVAAAFQAVLKAHTFHRGKLHIHLTGDNLPVLGKLRGMGAWQGKFSQREIAPDLRIYEHEAYLLKWIFVNVFHKGHEVWVNYRRSHVFEDDPKARIHDHADKLAKSGRWEGYYQRTAT